MTQTKIGIIGGSGLYQMEALQSVRKVNLETPFGPPSDAIILGELNQVPVAFLARHGQGHHLMPSEIPFRANIHAFKQVGVEYLISASAVGSLTANVKPLDIVIPDQFIDRTRHRVSSFFGEGIVAHIAFGHPVCKNLAKVLVESIENLALPGIDLHPEGTYVCIEGPAFSTLAESELYRSWGGSVIGMTNLPEAKLAREAEIAYATLALVTDYDCWHPDHEHVSVDMVIANLQHNAQNAQKIIQAVVQRLAANPPSSLAHQSLKNAILTPLKQAPYSAKERLALLIEKYL